MLASMAERKQYRGNHAANIILFYEYNMQKSKMLHLKGILGFSLYKGSLED